MGEVNHQGNSKKNSKNDQEDGQVQISMTDSDKEIDQDQQNQDVGKVDISISQADSVYKQEVEDQVNSKINSEQELDQDQQNQEDIVHISLIDSKKKQFKRQNYRCKTYNNNLNKSERLPKINPIIANSNKKTKNLEIQQFNNKAKNVSDKKDNKQQKVESQNKMNINQTNNFLFARSIKIQPLKIEEIKGITKFNFGEQDMEKQDENKQIQKQQPQTKEKSFFNENDSPMLKSFKIAIFIIFLPLVVIYFLFVKIVAPSLRKIYEYMERCFFSGQECIKVMCRVFWMYLIKFYECIQEFLELCC